MTKAMRTASVQSNFHTKIAKATKISMKVGRMLNNKSSKMRLIADPRSKMRRISPVLRRRWKDNDNERR